MRDDDRIDEWIEAFDENATFTAGDTVHRGRDAIKTLATSLSTGAWRGVHLLSEPVIDVDGDAARATTDWVYVAPGKTSRFEVRGVARYTDTFVRGADATWRYASRDVDYRR